MSSVTAGDNATTSHETNSRLIHPAWVRAMHWANAVAIVLMMMSGWQIYNASPLFNFNFPHAITLGGWLGGAIMWHLAAMWLLVVNGLFYLITGFATGRFRRKLTPISASGVVDDAKAALPASYRMMTSANTTTCRSCFMLGSWWSVYWSC